LHGEDDGPTVFLFTIREVKAWITSLSKRPYEVYAVKKAHRKLGSVHWMLHNDVHLRTSDWYNNPFSSRTWGSVPELWAQYASGFLSGALIPHGEHRPLCLIVRSEDILRNPRVIVEELTRLGLPRNGNPFEVIQDSLPGRGASRSQLLSSSTPNVFDGDDDALKELRRLMGPYHNLFEQLGHTPP